MSHARPIPSAVPRVSPRGIDLAAIGILLAALGLVLFATLRTPLKDDIAWLLYVARKWMEGKQLYIDLVEINPPLIIWLSAVPVKLGAWLGVPSRVAAMPFFALLVLGCAAWTAWLLRPLDALFARPIPVFAAIGSVLLLIPGPEVGQREHLLFAASLPYLAVLLRALAAIPASARAAFLSGVLAGLGVAMKPRYALAFAAVELFVLLRGLRPWRAQALGAGLLLLGYAGLTVWLYPAYLERAVPLALAIYGATDVTFQTLLWESRVMLLGLAALAVLTLLAFRRADRHRAIFLVLLLYAAASALVCFMDGKDWYYHRLPAIIATCFAVLLWLAWQAPAVLAGRGRAVAPAALAAATCLMFATASAQRIEPRLRLAFDPDVSTEAKLQRLLKKERAFTYVAFSEWIALGFPVVTDTEVTWASRFDSMWALKGELWRAQFDPEGAQHWPVRHWVARDFVAGCPDVVVADARGGPNYIGILSASNSAFARAWVGYRQIAAFDGLIVYRRDADGCGEVPPADPPMAHPDPAEINAPTRPMPSRAQSGSR
jgi:hypothetical protein